MTISSSDPLFSGPYTSTTTGPFDYEFVIFSEDELIVRKKAADGTLSVLTLSTDYTVSPSGGTFPARGTITLTTALATGEELVIEPNIALSQTRPFSSQDTITLQEIEDALDKVTAQNRAQQELLERAITLTNFDAIGDLQTLQNGILSVAAIEADIQAVAGDASDIGTVATDLAGDDSIGTVAANMASLTELAGLFPDGASTTGMQFISSGLPPNFEGAIDVTDNSIEPGFWRVNSTDVTSGLPPSVESGMLLHQRRAPGGGEFQTLVVDLPLELRGNTYTRARTLGVWTPWARIITSKNGTFLTSEWVAGTETAVGVISPAQLAAVLTANTSGPHSYTNGSEVIIAHGLSGTPKVFNGWLVCTTADQGFSVGDVLPIGDRNYLNSKDHGSQIHADATNVYVRMGNDGQWPLDSTGNLTPGQLTPANWDLYVRYSL